MIALRAKRAFIIGSILLILVIYLLARPQVKKFSGETMGTTYHITYISAPFSHPIKLVSEKVHNALANIDNMMSTYKNTSALMKFNHAPINQPITLPNMLISLIIESQQISALSHGAYDITVGPLVNLWGFGPRNQDPLLTIKEPKKNNYPAFSQWKVKPESGIIPSPQEIKYAQKYVGYHYLIANKTKNTLIKTKPVFVDLSSIAKGFGVDQAAKALMHLGIHNFMVEVGGEIKANGLKYNGNPWHLAINKPDLTGGKPTAIVTLKNKGLATSGDYLNFFTVGGKQYSHTINPVTGYPVTSHLEEVSVISNTVAQADGLATMFMVLGKTKGLVLANKHHIAAYFTCRTKTGLSSFSSQAFHAYLVK